ncbi:MAG: transglutaminase domain-containing protein [Clostridiaceae bacterium]
MHDYIINNTEYDYKNYKNKTIPNDDNIAYGVLVNKTAICGGYSEAMYRLLTAAGIESKVVFGDSEGEGHAWNMVKLNENYYHVDVTFDDPVMEGSE